MSKRVLRNSCLIRMIGWSVLGVALGSGAPCSADILNFSDVAVAGTLHEYLGASFNSLGYTFTTTSLDNVVDSGNDANPLLTPADGKNVYAIYLSPTGSGAFAPTGGGAFDLVSLDAMWWNHNYINGAESFTITGYSTDSTTRTFSGSAVPGSYQSVLLNWNNLYSVSFEASGSFGWFAIGNINVQPVQTVPEPGLWLLLVVVAAAMIFHRNWRREVSKEQKL